MFVLYVHHLTGQPFWTDSLNLAKLWNKPIMHEEWTDKGIERVAVISLMMASMTAQGHDATINFAMYHGYPVAKPGSHTASYNMAYDPARSAIFPALNLMFLRRDLTPNPRKIAYLLDEKLLFGNGAYSLNAKRDIRVIYPLYPLASFIAETSFVTSEEDISALLKRYPETEVVRPGDDPPDFPGQQSYPLTSGSGEIRLYWREGYFIVSSKRTKMAMGYCGAKGPLDLGDGITVNITTPGFVCFALTSLSNKPIASSSRIMLTAFSHAEVKGTLYDKDWKNQVIPDGKVMIKPLEGMVSFASSGLGNTPSANWYNQSQEMGSELSLSQNSGGLKVKIDGNGIVARIKE